MNANFELNRILDQWDKTGQLKQEAKNLFVYSASVEILRKYWEDIIFKSRKVAIFGGGDHTDEIFKVVEVPHNLDCIIDNFSQRITAFGVPVIRAEEINNRDIDTIVISSYSHRNEMKRTLIIENHYTGRIFDLYEALEKEGINISTCFYQNKTNRYKIINEIYRKFLSEAQGKSELLRKLIYNFICIKDFVSTFHFINLYLDSYYDLDGEMIKLKKNLTRLLENIHSFIIQKEQKSFMIFLIDSLRESEIKKMSNLSKIAEESFGFTDYVTEYPTTRESIISMLTGLHVFEDKLYEKRYVKPTDGKLFGLLSENKYEFYYFTDLRNHPYQKLSKNNKKYIDNLTAPEIFWNGLCQLIETEANLFSVFHPLQEVHVPHWNPVYGKELIRAGEYSVDQYDLYIEQYNSSLQYIDQQLNFYIHMFKSAKCTQIIMGDHGMNHDFQFRTAMAKPGHRSSTKITRWDEEWLKPALIILHEELGRGKCKGLVRNTSLTEIIYKIIDGTIKKEELEQMDEKFIVLEIMPVYGEALIDERVKSGNFKFILGAVGIRTASDTYVILENGEEEYYVMKSRENRINEVEYQERIQKLRDETKKYNVLDEVLKYEKFYVHNKKMRGIRMSQKLKERVELKKAEREELYCLEPPFPYTNFLVELSNACNHECIFCTHQKMKRKVGKIQKELLNSVLHQAYDLGTKEVGFYATGEPFLVNELPEYVKLAKEIGYDYVYLTSNGSVATPEKLKAVIDSGLDSIKFSINAPEPKMYEFIHGHNDFDKVLSHLEYLNTYRKESGKKYKIFITGILTRYTEHLKDEYFNVFEGLADEIVFKDVYNQGGNMPEIDSLLKCTYDKETYRRCNLPFDSIYVTCEGYLSVCNADYENMLVVADLNQVSLKDGWYGEKMKKLRQGFIEDNLTGTLCDGCVHHELRQAVPLTPEAATINTELFSDQKVKERLKKAGYI